MFLSLGRWSSSGNRSLQPPPLETVHSPAADMGHLCIFCRQISLIVWRLILHGLEIL